MVEQPHTRRPWNRRLALLVVLVALVLGVPTGQFGGRIGEGLGGEVGGLVGMVLGFLAVIAIGAAVAFALTARRGPPGPS